MALFRFKSRQVRDPAAQLNFEQLEGELPRSWLQLAVPLADGRRIAFGPDTLTFSASATSAARTVAHGLGVDPVFMVAQAMGGAAFCFVQLNSHDATNLVFQGHDTGGTSRTGTNPYFWMAIG